MAGQTYWEDVAEGMMLPPLAKRATTRQLVQYAGASLDFYEIHYDKDFALTNGLPNVVVHGALKSAWLVQMVTEWAGPAAVVRKLATRYRDMDVANDPLLCQGRVTKKYRESGLALVECDVWLENGRGQRTTDGSIVVELLGRRA